MANIVITGGDLRFEADTTEAVAFDVLDIVREEEPGDRAREYRLAIESSSLSFDRDVVPETAVAVFERLVTGERVEADIAGLVEGLTRKQRAFVGVLAATGGRIASTPLRERIETETDLSLSPRALGGSVKGLHRKAESALGERLTAAEWLEEQDEYEYWIKETYLGTVRNALDIED